MSQVDQAAGLRRWAEAQLQPEPQPQPQSQPQPRPEPQAAAPSMMPTRVLMTLGLPHGAASDVTPVTRTLRRWHDQGQRWVGDPDGWRVVPMDAQSPHLAVLATQQSRWALWVDVDPDGFRRAYATLKRLAAQNGPKRLLLVHPPLASRSGLLDNLQQAAASFLGIQLLVIGFSRHRRAPT